MSHSRLLQMHVHKREILKMYKISEDGKTAYSIDPNNKVILSIPVGHRLWSDYETWLSEGNIPKLIVEPLTELQIWSKEISAMDADMPRFMENHIRDEHNSTCTDAFMQAKYDAKVLKRSQKPNK